MELSELIDRLYEDEKLGFLELMKDKDRYGNVIYYEGEVSFSVTIPQYANMLLRNSAALEYYLQRTDELRQEIERLKKNAEEINEETL